MCCRTFLQIRYKHAYCQLALRVILSYRLTTGLFTSFVDHIEKLMALSILRVTEDSSRVETDMK